MRDKKVTLADMKGGDQGEREGDEGRKEEGEVGEHLGGKGEHSHRRRGGRMR